MPDIQCSKIFRSICCWGPFPQIKYSISTRIMNMVILAHQMFWTLLLRKEVIPTGYTCPKPEKANNYCNVNYGYMTVYIISGNFLVIYIIYTLIHINVKSSRDCRTNWHYGFWFIKIWILFSENCTAVTLDYLDLIIDLQTSLYYSGYVCTVAMIVLQFIAFWRTVHIVTIAILNRFSHRPTLAGLILNSIGISLFAFPITIGIMALYFFDTSTLKNEIFWGNLFISYGLGLIYSVFYLFQNRNRSLLGGVFTINVVFPTTVAMFHDNYKLYKTYQFTHTIYSFLHVIEVLMGVATLAFFVSYGLNKSPLNTENMIMVTEEVQSECCCCAARKETEVVLPRGVQDVTTCKRAYKTSDPYNDEYTQVKYSWEGLYLICGIFLMFFSSAVINWYEIPHEEVPADRPPYHNPNIQWVKFAASWMVAVVFIFFVIWPQLWEESP